MIFDIRHITEYFYEASAASAKLALRVTPMNGDGQNSISHKLTVAPNPRAVSKQFDFFGNTVTTVQIETPVTELKIDALTRIDVRRAPGPAAGTTRDWQMIVKEALELRSIANDAPQHFMFPSLRVPLHDDVTAYAAKSFPIGRPIVDGVRELAARIKADFTYSPDATEISTPLQTAFQQRHGVCQDFAHIMIAGLRGLGMPAAYVSGYIRTVPPPGIPRLVGADASHAWVSVWCGKDIGWIGSDPTNAIDIGSDHIVLAKGRDFSDVSPIYGVFLGSGAQGLSVSVDVAPVAG